MSAPKKRSLAKMNEDNNNDTTTSTSSASTDAALEKLVRTNTQVILESMKCVKCQSNCNALMKFKCATGKGIKLYCVECIVEFIQTHVMDERVARVSKCCIDCPKRSIAVNGYLIKELLSNLSDSEQFLLSLAQELKQSATQILQVQSFSCSCKEGTCNITLGPGNLVKSQGLTDLLTHFDTVQHLYNCEECNKPNCNFKSIQQHNKVHSMEKAMGKLSAVKDSDSEEFEKVMEEFHVVLTSKSLPEEREIILIDDKADAIDELW